MAEVEVNNNEVRKRKRIRELYQEIKDVEAGTIVLDDNDEPVEAGYGILDEYTGRYIVYSSGRPKRTKKTNTLGMKKEN